jgi:hypothetical protein
MGTATSRNAGIAALALLGLWAAGCGSGSRTTHSATAASGPQAATSARLAPSAPSSRTAFAWLHPAPVPPGWATARLSTGATLAYPAPWRPLAGDRGTASAALLGTSGPKRYLGYLNVTPRQGGETASGWSSFRVRHNRAEGEREVRLEAAARNLRFRGGAGSCVRDSYATITGARYIEIACLVTGRRASSVIVGAAPPDRWSQSAPAIEGAISAFST